MKQDELQIEQNRLVEAWNRVLPMTLNETDSADVHADEADAKSLRVHIRTAGRSQYTFDFQVTYVDSREVMVQLIDVEQDGINVDEHHDIVQTLVEDYVRHIHEAAQQLHSLTHA